MPMRFLHLYLYPIPTIGILRTSTASEKRIVRLFLAFSRLASALLVTRAQPTAAGPALPERALADRQREPPGLAAAGELARLLFARSSSSLLHLV